MLTRKKQNKYRSTETVARVMGRNALIRFTAVSALMAVLCVPACAQNYTPPPSKPKKPAGRLIMEYKRDSNLFRAAPGKPVIKRNPAYLTNEKNPQAVAEVLAGKRSTANAAWWGFDEKDSTAILQAAFDSGAKKLLIPNMGKDWIVEPLFLNKDNQEIIFEPGVVIMAKKGSFRGKNDTLITAMDRSNITLRGYGATLRMHIKDYQSPPYVKSEWRNCLVISGGSDIKILGLAMRDSGGDGIYLGGSITRGTNNKRILIKDVICDNNNRQGLTVITAEDLLVENSVFSNTKGTSPMAGIDLEPNHWSQKLVNIRIRNCRMNDNDLGMHMYLGKLNSQSEDISVVWENCYVRGGKVGIHFSRALDDGPKGQIVYRNIIVQDTREAGIKISDKSRDSVRIVFDRVLLTNVATKQGPPILLRAVTGKRKTIRPGGVKFNNCFVHLPEGGKRVLRDDPILRLTNEVPDDESDDLTWGDVTGSITVSSPHGAIKQVEAPTDNVSVLLNGQ